MFDPGRGNLRAAASYQRNSRSGRHLVFGEASAVCNPAHLVFFPHDFNTGERLANLVDWNVLP